MDLEPKQLLERYLGHAHLERKRLELEEDRILNCLMHNMVAFMVMTGVPKDRIRKKLRRLVAKSHIGLHYSQEINLLLDSLDYLDGNDIDLKMVPSRTKMRQQYKVHRGIDKNGQVLFLEVCYLQVVLFRFKCV
ncbi:hypothetical protein Ciccas_011476 [Cichlidogyrus casuarinus]|uniref:MAP kinase-activating death domain-containing protein n=1 Tax=Cichlidogyrus casuarinus TaxID=1844966 RepID=A0ABD2PRZ6_9PLAT